MKIQKFGSFFRRILPVVTFVAVMGLIPMLVIATLTMYKMVEAAIKVFPWVLSIALSGKCLTATLLVAVTVSFYVALKRAESKGYQRGCFTERRKASAGRKGGAQEDSKILPAPSEKNKMAM